MSKLYTILLIALACATQPNNLVAQTSTSTTTEYKASIKGWEVDLNKAIAMSKKTGKPILANFTGTDWCGWCIRLRREVFDKPEFTAWAAENVILLEVDFPRRTKLPEAIAKQNRELQQIFRVQGYPTLWVFNVVTDPTTKAQQIEGVAKTGYVAGGPNAWIRDLQTKMKQQ